MDIVGPSGVIIPPRTEGHVDVSRLMEQIQASIRQKWEQGIYLEMRLDDEMALEMRDLARKSGLDEVLATAIATGGDDWNIRPDYQITTHRRGLAAAVTVIKRLARPFVRLYTDFVVHRQSLINQYTARGIRELVRDQVLLRRDCRELRHKGTLLEREVHRLREHLEKRGIPLPAEQVLPAANAGESGEEENLS